MNGSIRINEEQAKHCVSLALTNDDPVPIIKIIKQNYSDYIPVEAYHWLSNEVASALYNDYDKIVAKITREINVNQSILLSIIQRSTSSNLPDVFAYSVYHSSVKNPNLNLFLWALDRLPNIKISKEEIMPMFSQIRDADSLSKLLSRKSSIQHVDGFEISLIESGSMAAYDFLVEHYSFLQKNNLVTSIDRQGLVLKAILSSSNPEAIKFFERFLADADLTKDFGKLIDLFSSVDLVDSSKKPRNLLILKSIASRITRDQRLGAYYDDLYFFKPLISSNLKALTDENELKILMQKHLLIDLTEDSSIVLLERLESLDQFDPDWVKKVFDGSNSDPINYSMSRIDLVKVLLDRLEKVVGEENPIDCRSTDSPALFEGLEAFPYSLYEKFEKCYINFPRYQSNAERSSNLELVSPERYQLYRIADPRVLYRLMGKSARSLDHLNIEVIVETVLPMMLYLENLGWIVEILRGIHRNVAEKVEDWFVDSKQNTDEIIARNTFQQYLPIQKFSVFLSFFSDRVLSIDPLSDPVSMTMIGYSIDPSQMSPESLTLFICQTKIADTLRPKLLSFVRWLERRLNNYSFLAAYAETASPEGLEELVRGIPDFFTQRF